MKSWVTQVRKGVAELAILHVLRSGEVHGYGILQRLAQEETLRSGEGTIYPLLARLTADGLVDVRQQPSVAGPPRRTYRLTLLGEARLREMQTWWEETKAALDRLATQPAAQHPAHSPTPPDERSQSPSQADGENP